MKIQEVIHAIEGWIPKQIAWEKDNVGLQIGDGNREISGILVTLEVTDDVIQEAVEQHADLIVTHHPLIFKPLKSIHLSDTIGRRLRELIQHGIALYSAHTNLDSARGGVSFALAKALGLQDVEFLVRQTGTLKKIAVFVPVDYVDKVTDAMAQGGAGIIGKYERCSFRTSGKGTFKSSSDARPFIGKAGELETADEVKIEMLAPSWAVPDVIREMLEAHPYEEVAYDIYTLENENVNFGSGAIGNLEQDTILGDFLEVVKKTLTIPFVRFIGDTASTIRRIAVCGGGGSSLLPAAIQQRADAFITADVSYHTFHDAVGKICLIDAGHYETEQFAVAVLVQHLRTSLGTVYPDVRIFPTQRVTNPIKYL